MPGAEFSFEPTQRSQRLTVTASKAVIDAAMEHLGDKQKLGTRADIDGERASLGINAGLIGKLRGPQASTLKSDYLSRIHRCINSLAAHTNSDTTLRIPVYRPLHYGYFDMEIDFNRPYEASRVLQQRSIAAMQRMSTDLRHLTPNGFPKATVKQYDMSLRLTDTSYMRSSDDITQGQSARPELIGNNIRQGSEPLIYLAGAVALTQPEQEA